MRSTTQILDALDADDRSEGSLPERLCVDCATTLDLRGTGMALMNRAGHQGVVAASGPLAADLENLQFELGEGPSLDASRANILVFETDLAATAMTPWPGFGPAAVAAGVRGVFAIPLQVGAVQLGSLCLYRSAPGQLDGEDTATALAYADAAVAVLLGLQAQVQPGSALHPDLGEPLDHRAEVHQATGFLSVHASVDLTDALLLLRAHAYASGRPLVDIARDVLAGRLRIQAQEGEDG